MDASKQPAPPNLGLVYVEFKDVYGRQTIYPYCAKAKAFARIAGTKTLSADDLREIKTLGFQVATRNDDLGKLSAIFGTTKVTPVAAPAEAVKTAVVKLPFNRVQAMLGNDEERTGNKTEVKIAPSVDLPFFRTTITGNPQQVMFALGIIAANGEDALESVGAA